MACQLIWDYFKHLYLQFWSSFLKVFISFEQKVKILNSDKIKQELFQVVAVFVLLYDCTTWTLMKRLERKLDGNYTKVLSTVFNKSWKQLFGHLPPISQTNQSKVPVK